jgi:hypothetical protein
MNDQECTETGSSEPELLQQRSGVFERRHILTGCQGTVRGAVSIGPLGAVGVGVLLEEQTDVEEARKALGTTLLDCLNMVELAEKLITL